MISIEHLHPSGSGLRCLNLTSNHLDEKREEYFRFCREFGRNLFEKEKDNASATVRERKTGALGQRFEEKWREVVPQEEQDSEYCTYGKTGTCKDERSVAHLVKEVMIIRENALDKLDSKCFMKVVELQGLWALAIAKKTQVLEDGECATRGMSQRLGCFIWQCNRLELIGVEQTTIFLNSLSTTKITSWSRVAAVFDHTTAALDLCSFKQSNAWQNIGELCIPKT
jgi:hypothetical protein